MSNSCQTTGKFFWWRRKEYRDRSWSTVSHIPSKSLSDSARKIISRSVYVETNKPNERNNTLKYIELMLHFNIPISKVFFRFSYSSKLIWYIWKSLVNGLHWKLLLLLILLLQQSSFLCLPSVLTIQFRFLFHFVSPFIWSFLQHDVYCSIELVISLFTHLLFNWFWSFIWSLLFWSCQNTFAFCYMKIKKPLVHFIIFDREWIWDTLLMSYIYLLSKKNFYDKMDLRLFCFHVMIYLCLGFVLKLKFYKFFSCAHFLFHC